MRKYVIKTTDGSIARYSELYVDVDADDGCIGFKYSNGTSIFYPYANIIFFKIEEAEDDEED